MKLVKTNFMPGRWVKAFALRPFIFHKNAGFKETPLFAHEAWHFEQQRVTGTFKWLFLYLFSSKFRFRQELEALAAEAWWVKNFHGGKHGPVLRAWANETWRRRYRLKRVPTDHEIAYSAGLVRRWARTDPQLSKILGFTK